MFSQLSVILFEGRGCTCLLPGPFGRGRGGGMPSPKSLHEWGQVHQRGGYEYTARVGIPEGAGMPEGGGGYVYPPGILSRVD